MSTLTVIANPKVSAIFKAYPPAVRPKMEALRQLVLKTAQETEGLTQLEETLKWGEPSYVTPIGSTLRMDWKAKTPQQYALYFQCTSRLVETFQQLFKNTLSFEGNRAIVFHLEQELPIEPLTYCIQAALTYHKVKHLPTLGI